MCDQAPETERVGVLLVDDHPKILLDVQMPGIDRAYVGLVREQSFHAGRDVALAPPAVHREVTDEDTGLAANHRVYRDGTLWLQGNAPPR